MLDQPREQKFTQEDIMNLALELIKLHKNYEHTYIIGVKLETHQAIDAAHVTASQLAKYTAESRWYRVQTYLDELKYNKDG
jgi:hypothetical protein